MPKIDIRGGKGSLEERNLSLKHLGFSLKVSLSFGVSLRAKRELDLFITLAMDSGDGAGEVKQRCGERV